MVPGWRAQPGLLCSLQKKHLSEHTHSIKIDEQWE